MRTFTEITRPTMNLLGQDIRDMVVIMNHFAPQDVVGVKQDKQHGVKEYTVRVCNCSGNQPTALRDVLVAIDGNRVEILDSIRII